MNGNAYRENRSPSIGNTSAGSSTIAPSTAPLTSPPLEQTFEQKLGIGPSIPVQMSQESPKDPPPTMRARSGTGKSVKDKKSMFGVLSGEYDGEHCHGSLF